MRVRFCSKNTQALLMVEASSNEAFLSVAFVVASWKQGVGWLDRNQTISGFIGGVFLGLFFGCSNWTDNVSFHHHHVDLSRSDIAVVINK